MAMYIDIWSHYSLHTYKSQGHKTQHSTFNSQHTSHTKHTSHTRLQRSGLSRQAHSTRARGGEYHGWGCKGGEKPDPHTHNTTRMPLGRAAMRKAHARMLQRQGPTERAKIASEQVYRSVCYRVYSWGGSRKIST